MLYVFIFKFMFIVLTVVIYYCNKMDDAQCNENVEINDGSVVEICLNNKGQDYLVVVPLQTATLLLNGK